MSPVLTLSEPKGAVTPAVMNELTTLQSIFGRHGGGAARLLGQAMCRIDELESRLDMVKRFVNGAPGVAEAKPDSAETGKTRDNGRELRSLPAGKLLHPEHSASLEGGVTIVVQGRLNPVGIAAIREYLHLGPVIVSCWDTCDQSMLEGLDFRYVTVVTTPVPPPGTGYNVQNLLLQATSTLKGLEKVRTANAIKVRCDELWADLFPAVQAVRRANGKLVTTNVFFREDALCKFHISDHIIGGNTQVLKDTFRRVVEDCMAFRPVPHPGLGSWPAEPLIAQAFLRTIGVEPDPPNSKTQMRTHFELVLAEEMAPFHIISNSWAVAMKTPQDLLDAGSIGSWDDL